MCLVLAMANFGSDFGVSSLGGDPTHLSPRLVVDRVLSELSFLRNDGTGTGTDAVNTIDVLTESPDSDDAIERMCHNGTPAILFGYIGSNPVSGTATRMRFEREQKFAAVCIADDSRSREDRIGGYGRLYAPGLWDLTALALHYCGRALYKLRKSAMPGSESFSYTPLHFVGTVIFTIRTVMDVAEDISTTRLQSLGITHTPIDSSKLFEDDNVTPYSDDGTNNTPNVADVSE